MDASTKNQFVLAEGFPGVDVTTLLYDPLRVDCLTKTEHLWVKLAIGLNKRVELPPGLKGGRTKRQWTLADGAMKTILTGVVVFVFS